MFKNKDAIVLARVRETGKTQLEHWHNVVVTEDDPMKALLQIAADFSYNPSSESAGFQLCKDYVLNNLNRL